MCLDFDVRDNRRSTVSLEEELLSIIDMNYSQKKRFEVKSVLMLVCFSVCLLQMLTDVMWCFYQTLILMAPIHFHCWDTDAETHFSKSDEDTNYISDDLRMVFEWTAFLNSVTDASFRVASLLTLSSWKASLMKPDDTVTVWILRRGSRVHVWSQKDSLSDEIRSSWAHTHSGWCPWWTRTRWHGKVTSPSPALNARLMDRESGFWLIPAHVLLWWSLAEPLNGLTVCILSSPQARRCPDGNH